MGPDDLNSLHVAFALIGAGIGFAVGKYVHDHFQFGAAPGLFSLVGAVLFYFAAFYLLMLLLVTGAIGLCWLTWRCRAFWSPLIEPLRRRLLIWRRAPSSVAAKLTAEMDDYNSRTEAVLSQHYPPEIKQKLLEQLEVQHQNRIRGLLTIDDSMSGG